MIIIHQWHAVECNIYNISYYLTAKLKTIMGKLLSKTNSPTETKEENNVDQFENVEKIGNESPIDLNSVEKSEILQSVNKNRAPPPGNRRRPMRDKTTPSSKSEASPSGENTENDESVKEQKYYDTHLSRH